jgi:hypothetical protein
MTSTAQEDLIMSAARSREAAVANASSATTTDLDQQIQAVVSMCEQKLVNATKKYQLQVEQLMSQANAPKTSSEATDPVSSFFGITYQWWNLLMLGPFQAVAPLGPFRPSKIIRAGEPAFMVAALWRNPLPLPGGPNPSAAQIMSPFTYRIRGEVINLSAVSNGLDYTPVTATFGAPFINLHVMSVPTATPAPTDGSPTLLEANFTVDILGPGVGLPPFAGYSTWLFDPDNEPGFVFPFIPGVGPVVIPGTGPQLQHDIPARYLVYV